MILLFKIYLFSTLPVSIWLFFFHPEKGDRFAKEHENIFGAVVLGSFMCLTMIFCLGLDQFLVFIPDDTIRSPIAILIGFFLSGFLFVYVFGNFEKLHMENKRLSEREKVFQEEMRIIAEVKKRKDDLRYRSHETLIKKRGNIEAALQKLREPSSNSSTELRVMEALLDEVNYQIEVTKPNALN